MGEWGQLKYLCGALRCWAHQFIRTIIFLLRTVRSFLRPVCSNGEHSYSIEFIEYGRDKEQLLRRPEKILKKVLSVVEELKTKRTELFSFLAATIFKR